MGRDLAKLDRRRRHRADARSRGDRGRPETFRHAVYISVYLEVNARLWQAGDGYGEVKSLTSGEVG
jgi:hypothetical protein